MGHTELSSLLGTTLKLAPEAIGVSLGKGLTLVKLLVEGGKLEGRNSSGDDESSHFLFANK